VRALQISGRTLCLRFDDDVTKFTQPLYDLFAIDKCLAAKYGNEIKYGNAAKYGNGISRQIKSVQSWKAIILNISPTCLNWKKMEALLTVIWRYMQSTLKI